jgi:hypothetical protein
MHTLYHLIPQSVLVLLCFSCRTSC